MATFTSTSGSYTTTLTVTQTSQSTQNNQSTLTYSLTLTKNSGTGLWNNNSCPWSITIDGSTVASGSFTYDFRSYSSLTLKGSTTTTVTHNSDGTKTVACSASVNMDNEPYVYVMKPSGDLALTTIPRASDVSVSNYSITSTNGSISYTVTSKANFYHTYKWSLANYSSSSETQLGQINATSKSFSIHNQTLLSVLPTQTSGSITITIYTYSDSGYTNLIGSKSASATVTVDTSQIKPTVTLGNIAIQSQSTLDTSLTVPVAGYTKLQSSYASGGGYGTTSRTGYFTVSHGSLQNYSSGGDYNIYTNIIPSSASNYTLTIYAYSKDGRGAASDTVSKSTTVYGYTPPTATLRAYRVADSTSTTEDGAGNYVYVTFSGAISSSLNNQNAIQSVSCTYRGSISGTATNGQHIALSDTQSVTFTLTVNDKVTTSTTTVTVSSASYPLDLYDDGNGVVGAGIGMVANPNQLGTPLPTYFPSRMQRHESSYYTGDLDDLLLDAWGTQTIVLSSPSATNAPTATYYHVETFSENRNYGLQIATRIDNASVRYYRSWYGSTGWSAWVLGENMGKSVLTSTTYGNLTIQKVGQIVQIIYSTPTNLPTGTSTTIYTLPEQYRPSYRIAQDFNIPSSTNTVRVFVMTDGRILAYNYSSITTNMNIECNITYVVTNQIIL